MRKVIFTAIVGQYDEITQPQLVVEDYEYVIFSNDISEDRLGIWQVRKIPYRNDDPTRVARWVKTHPHILFPDYQYSVWIDGNVKIIDKKAYDIFNDLYNKGVIVSSFAHSRKNCAYKECLGIMLSGKDTLQTMMPEVLHLKEEGYPVNNGLCETNCVFMRLDSPKVHDFCETWWGMIEQYSKRDQLSFNYALWKNRIPTHYLLGKHHCARNHVFFNYVGHAGSSKGIGYFRRCIRYSFYLVSLIIMNRMILATDGSRVESYCKSLLYRVEKVYHAVN